MRRWPSSDDMSAAPVTFQMISRPASSDSPPMPVTTSAWKAARRAASRWLSKPISRNEVIEVSSQNTNSMMKPSATHQAQHGAHEHEHEGEEAALPRVPFEIAAANNSTISVPMPEISSAKVSDRPSRRQERSTPRLGAQATAPVATPPSATSWQKAGEMDKQQRRDQRQRPSRVVAEQTRQGRRDGSARERQKERKEGERLRLRSP